MTENAKKAVKTLLSRQEPVRWTKRRSLRAGNIVTSSVARAKMSRREFRELCKSDLSAYFPTTNA